MSAITVLLSMPPSAACTAIAISFDRGDVIIAADSSIVVRGAGGAVRETGCKLLQNGNVVFAVSGFLYLGGKDLRDLARAAIRATPTIADAGDAFAESAKSLLGEAFRWARRNQPGLMRETAAVFAARNAETGKIEVRGVVLFERDNLPFPAVEATRLDCGGGCNRETFLMLGSQTAARAAFPRLLRDRGLSGREIAERLVRIEMEANPDEVGGPLQTVRLRGRRIEWFRRPASCLSAP